MYTTVYGMAGGQMGSATSLHGRDVAHCGAPCRVSGILATCPTNWSMTPRAAITWSLDNLMLYCPPGNLRDPWREGEKNA